PSPFGPVVSPARQAAPRRTTPSDLTESSAPRSHGTGDPQLHADSPFSIHAAVSAATHAACGRSALPPALCRLVQVGRRAGGSVAPRATLLEATVRAAR